MVSITKKLRKTLQKRLFLLDKSESEVYITIIANALHP